MKNKLKVNFSALKKTLDKLLVDSIEDNSILLEADKIVNGERRSDYGANDSFARMATVHNNLWGTTFVATDFVKMLMTVKLVRESFKHKRDNLVDLAGYTELLNRLQ